MVMTYTMPPQYFAYFVPQAKRLVSLSTPKRCERGLYNKTPVPLCEISKTLALRSDGQVSTRLRGPGTVDPCMSTQLLPRTSGLVSRRRKSSIYFRCVVEAERFKETQAQVNDHSSRILRNSLLPSGSCKGNALFIDASVAGISGDMFVGALLDLGVPFELLCRQLSQIDLHGYSVLVNVTERSCIAALRFSVESTGAGRNLNRNFLEIQDLVNSSNLTEGTKKKALAAFTALAKAEGSTHGIHYEHVCFHEVGAVDSIVDIVAVAICLEYLNVQEIYVSPLPLGNGIIRGTSHGPLPAPAPATLDCLCQSPVYAFHPGVDGEFVTPTGACLAATLSANPGHWPNMCRLFRVGYGAGSKSWADRPNLLRIVLGLTDSA